jgi:hypothetical protein
LKSANFKWLGDLKVTYWSLDATNKILLHFSPKDFKNGMGNAKKLKNENARPINSEDLA